MEIEIKIDINMEIKRQMKIKIEIEREMKIGPPDSWEPLRSGFEDKQRSSIEPR